MWWRKVIFDKFLPGTYAYSCTSSTEWSNKSPYFAGVMFSTISGKKHFGIGTLSLYYHINTVMYSDKESRITVTSIVKLFELVTETKSYAF